MRQAHPVERALAEHRSVRVVFAARINLHSAGRSICELSTLFSAPGLTVQGRGGLRALSDVLRAAARALAAEGSHDTPGSSADRRPPLVIDSERVDVPGRDGHP